MTHPQVGRSGSGQTAPPTVFDRLRVKQSRPGRAVRRRQLRTAKRMVATTRRDRLSKWLHGYAQSATRVNTARDYKSRRSGRLRKELQ